VSNVLFSLLDDEPKTSNDDGSRPVLELTPVSSMSSIFTQNHPVICSRSSRHCQLDIQEHALIMMIALVLQVVVSTLDRGSIHVRHLTCPQSSSHPLPVESLAVEPRFWYSILLD